MDTSGPDGAASSQESFGTPFVQHGMGDLWKSGAAVRAQSFGHSDPHDRVDPVAADE